MDSSFRQWAARCFLLYCLMPAWILPSSPTVWVSLGYLVVGTVVTFLLYLFILGRWTATGASYAFVLNPLVAVVLAALLTDEVISLMFLAGMLGGIFWALLAGWLKVYGNVHEIFGGVGLNFIAQNLTLFLILRPWASRTRPCR